MNTALLAAILLPTAVLLAFLIPPPQRGNPHAFRDFLKEVWEAHCRQSERIAMFRLGINPDNQDQQEDK